MAFPGRFEFGSGSDLGLAGWQTRDMERETLRSLIRCGIDRESESLVSRHANDAFNSGVDGFKSRRTWTVLGIVEVFLPDV